MRPPQFIQKLKNLTINDGEHLELTAKVDGDPVPQITWSKDGKMLSSSEIVDLKYKNGVATFTINEVFPEDEGEYACLATNSIGSDTTSCKLTVKPVENAARKKQSDEKSPKIVDHSNEQIRERRRGCDTQLPNNRREEVRRGVAAQQ
ncbi:nexilin-like [Temnothorax longispinosus]|uniref:nexilin-like n=1 Tax=Temnothorax longispinosus TaxID=300112 RepID=UPI003A9A6313